MFAAGLMEETQAVLHLSDAERIKPLGALGYRQARAVLEGNLSREEAVSLQRNRPRGIMPSAS
jgi:tRNA A37 N6-isopentenylltransferase MiaA